MPDQLDWSGDLCLDVEILDEEHRKLLALMKSMATACLSRVGDYVLNKVTAELVDYTHNHFRREESSMQHHGYDGLHEHRLEHRKLIAQLDEILFQVASAGQTGISGGIVDQMGQWVTDHIVDCDRRYADFLKAKGIAG